LNPFSKVKPSPTTHRGMLENGDFDMAYILLFNYKHEEFMKNYPHLGKNYSI
jgi:hypothetical protein